LHSCTKFADNSSFGDRRESVPVEVYSEKVLKWYEVSTKPVEWMCGARADTFLVWFSDVTVRKNYDRRQHDLLQYADWLAPRVKDSGWTYKNTY
jgi:hypothetical protein